MPPMTPGSVNLLFSALEWDVPLKSSIVDIIHTRVLHVNIHDLMFQWWVTKTKMWIRTVLWYTLWLCWHRGPDALVLARHKQTAILWPVFVLEETAASHWHCYHYSVHSIINDSNSLRFQFWKNLEKKNRSARDARWHLCDLELEQSHFESTAPYEVFHHRFQVRALERSMFRKWLRNPCNLLLCDRLPCTLRICHSDRKLTSGILLQRNALNNVLVMMSINL